VVPFSRSSAPPHDHAVNFYDDDAEWVDRIAGFVQDGFGQGERVIVIATSPHLVLLEEILSDRGVDLPESRTTGRLLTLDADVTLSALMPGGRPHAGELDARVGGLIDAATADGSLVRIFGEMVAVLWEQGNVAGAIELESMWNELAKHRRFTLLCAYPLGGIGDMPLGDVHHVCDLHSRLLPPRSYTSTRSMAAVRPDLGDDASKTFVGVPAAVSAVRRFVSDLLRSWDLAALIPDATLVASELATNAVRHAHSPFRVSVRRLPAAIRLAVEDCDRSHPALCRPTLDATWGRGVLIVDDVSHRWGSEPLAQGKRVWADLHLPDQLLL
jgi:MEDS: MEthanogen/methylotroph, DcmR Sensory domain/Histidine kinase-like ATPase domain